MSVTERIEPEGERKLVTVLFADVQGSMDMAEQQDPEQWRSIMQRFFSVLSDAVNRFEGTVDKFTGDGIMAVFGAPIAHEDHAQARLLRGAADARRRLRVRGRAAPQARAQLLDPDRDQLGRGDRRRDRRRRRRQLHRDRAHGRARAADGGAGRARQGLPRRGGGRAGAWLPRPRGPGRVRDQGLEPPGPGLRAGGASARPALAARPLPRAGLLPVRRARGGAGGARGGARGGAGGKRRRRRDRRRSGARQEPAHRRVRRDAAATGGSRSTKRRPRRMARRRRSRRSSRSCAPTSASPTPTRTGSPARRSPGGRCSSTPA